MFGGGNLVGQGTACKTCKPRKAVRLPLALCSHHAFLRIGRTCSHQNDLARCARYLELCTAPVVTKSRKQQKQGPERTGSLSQALQQGTHLLLLQLRARLPNTLTWLQLIQRFSGISAMALPVTAIRSALRTHRVRLRRLVAALCLSAPYTERLLFGLGICAKKGRVGFRPCCAMGRMHANHPSSRRIRVLFVLSFALLAATKAQRAS